MPKQKSHKSTLKRIKITGTGKVKFNRPGKGHLNSHKSGRKLMKLRQAGVAKKGDVKRLERILHQPVTPG